MKRTIDSGLVTSIEEIETNFNFITLLVEDGNATIIRPVYMPMMTAYKGKFVDIITEKTGKNFKQIVKHKDFVKGIEIQSIVKIPYFIVEEIIDKYDRQIPKGIIG